ncbi:MAG TPA: SMP-30/gluconolactonase/LRE family protein [Terriglobia bacterium]|nr:SMP-30/gluconolactonase/LRE family protein [Terriglobia bacterium]
MNEVTVVADFGDLCGECPVWNSEYSVLEWIDCVGGKLLRIEWPSIKSAVAKSGVSISGFRRNQPGGYVISNSQGIWLWDGAEDFSPVITEVASRTCQANDCVADSAGRFITATYYYDPSNAYDLGNLISVDTDGKLTILDEGFHLANGLGFSPDGSTLYLTDSAARRIYRYDYDVRSGSVRNRRTLVEVPGDEGLPDGLAVDAEGYIWSAQWYGSCIVRYDSDGKLIHRVSIPAKQTSSLTFGGPDLTDIFVTSAGQSEPMPIMPPGYDPKSGNFGGALYHLNLGIEGLQHHSANIALRAR